METEAQPIEPCNALVRQSFHRVAHFDRSLPSDLASLLWHVPMSLLRRGEPLQASAARRTVRLEWNSELFVLKHYAEPTRRHAARATRRSPSWSLP